MASVADVLRSLEDEASCARAVQERYHDAVEVTRWDGTTVWVSPTVRPTVADIVTNTRGTHVAGYDVVPHKYGGICVYLGGVRGASQGTIRFVRLDVSQFNDAFLKVLMQEKGCPR